jgi:hypothetical protein
VKNEDPVKYLAGDVQASVAILFPVCRWLADRNHMQYGTLKAALRPESLVQGGDNALLATLSVGCDVGVISRQGASPRTTDQDASWALSEPIRSQRDYWHADPLKFRRMVREALLAKAVDKITQNETPSDVAVGLAWLMAQDPARPPAASYSEGPEKALIDQNLKDFIGTPEQWRGFTRWALALGCATQLSASGGRKYLLPDPTPAIAEELPAIQSGGLPAKQFCAAVVKSLPILDGGTVADYTRRRVTNSACPASELTIGPAFSFALQRLAGSGTIRLIAESDAADRVSGLLYGQIWTFDRVELTNGGSHG